VLFPFSCLETIPKHGFSLPFLFGAPPFSFFQRCACSRALSLTDSPTHDEGFGLFFFPDLGFFLFLDFFLATGGPSFSLVRIFNLPSPSLFSRRLPLEAFACTDPLFFIGMLPLASAGCLFVSSSSRTAVTLFPPLPRSAPPPFFFFSNLDSMFVSLHQAVTRFFSGESVICIFSNLFLPGVFDLPLPLSCLL